MIKIADIILEPAVLTLCRKPYPGHPRGCPNYAHRKSCPPDAPFLEEVLDMSRTVWVAWVDFNLEKQRQRMWAKHPKWSERQAECCLYWQGGVRKQLRDEMEAFVDNADAALMIIEVPEAHGVNVTETMWRVGVGLQWPPKIIVRKVGLIGWKHPESEQG